MELKSSRLLLFFFYFSYCLLFPGQRIMAHSTLVARPYFSTMSECKGFGMNSVSNFTMFILRKITEYLLCVKSGTS